MPSELFRKENGYNVMWHGVGSGLFKGKLLSVKKASHHSNDRGHGRGERHAHERRPPYDNGRLVPLSQISRIAADRAAYNGYAPTGTSATRNAMMAQTGGRNYIQHNVFNVYPPPGGAPAGYRPDIGRQHRDNDTRGPRGSGSTAHDPRTCEIHPECLRAQLAEVRKAKTVYVGSSTRSETPVRPSSSISQAGDAQSLASTPSMSWEDKTWVPELQEDSQKTTKEHAVASLARVYAPKGFGGLRSQPDLDFDIWDCKLLALMELKHNTDRGRDLQAEFYKATRIMVDARILEKELDLQDSRTGFTAGSRLSTRHREILAYCDQRLDETKIFAIQADFFKETGRMIDPQVLKQKLG